MSAYELLSRYPDRSRPLVTHYAGAGSRVELSVATTANAVAKAAGLLRDGLAVAPGGEVSIDLPRHWQLPVWTLAALSVGARCSRGATGPVEVRIAGPDGPGVAPADAVVVSACDAFGLPVPGGLPAGAIDAAEARAHPDDFQPEPGAAAAAGLEVRGAPVPWVDMLAEPGLALLPGLARTGDHSGRGARLWVDDTTEEELLLLAVSVAPLLLLGSVVIATGVSPHEAARIRAVEGVSTLAT